MKTIVFALLLTCAFFGGGCSRSDKQPDTDTKVQNAANSNLKADAERLQRATAKAAEERRRAQAQASATPGVTKP